MCGIVDKCGNFVLLSTIIYYKMCRKRLFINLSNYHLSHDLLLLVVRMTRYDKLKKNYILKTLLFYNKKLISSELTNVHIYILFYLFLSFEYIHNANIGIVSIAMIFGKMGFFYNRYKMGLYLSVKWVSVKYNMWFDELQGRTRTYTLHTKILLTLIL